MGRSRSRSAGALALLLAVLAGPAAGPSRAVPRTIQEHPDYRPPADPESASVRIGRRLGAPRVRMPFAGGLASLDAIGRAVCWAAHHQDADTLRKLTITEREFRTILWREFPNSRPITGITAEDAWGVASVRFAAGIRGFLGDYGGEPLEFVRVERADTVAVFRNFRVHQGLTVVARRNGVEERIPYLRAVAERGGRFKIMGVHD